MRLVFLGCIASIICLTGLDGRAFVEGDRFGGFLVERSVAIPLRSLHVTELVHEESRARVLHVHAPDPENFFSISFLTPAYSSNGVAHVLEHSCLDGSKRFTAPNLFYKRAAQSQATFMNAMTGADATAYTVASCVESDFYALLDYYVDAVFHPLLTPATFFREGRRLEFQDPNDPESLLRYTGIVYNEMQAALSAPLRRLSYLASRALFPTTSYRFCSGGDPKEIVQLTHAELVQFHKKYYVPSNALFFFYGDIPLEKHLQFLESKEVFAGLEKGQPPVLAFEPKRTEKVCVEEVYPGHPGTKADRLRISWLVSEAHDPFERLIVRLLDSILMDSDVSLLKKKLLASGYCSDARGYFSSTQAQAYYSIDCIGVSADEADAIEAFVVKSLREIADDGISRACIDRAIKDFIFAIDNRDSSRDPVGLSLFFSAALRAHYGEDVVEALDLDALIARIQKSLNENPDLFRDALRRYFVNPLYVRALLRPSEIEEGHVLDREKYLAELQAQVETPVETANEPSWSFPEGRVCASPNIQPLRHYIKGYHDLYFFNTPLKRTVAFDFFVRLSEVPQDDLWIIQLLCDLAPRLGIEGYSADETVALFDEYAHDLSLDLVLLENKDPAIHLHVKAHPDDAKTLLPLCVQLLTMPALDDPAHLQSLVASHAAFLRTAVNTNPLPFALAESRARIHTVQAATRSWKAMEYVRRIDQLQQGLSESFMSRCREVVKGISSPQQVDLVVSCERARFKAFLKSALRCLHEGFSMAEFVVDESWFSPDERLVVSSNSWVTDLPVAFTAQSIPVVMESLPSRLGEGVFVIAAELCQECVLTKEIRLEGGAYGAGAVFRADTGDFTFYSVRDPHITRTVSSFRRSLQVLAEGQFTDSELEEARLQIVKEECQPVADHLRARSLYLTRYDPGQDARFYESVYRVTREDVQQAALYLLNALSESSVVTFASEELLRQDRNHKHK